MGLKDPQFAALQLATQSTPASVTSFVTFTMRVVCDPNCRACGGESENDTTIALALGGKTDLVTQADSPPRVRIKTSKSKDTRPVMK